MINMINDEGKWPTREEMGSMVLGEPFMVDVFSTDGWKETRLRVREELRVFFFKHKSRLRKCGKEAKMEGKL